MKITSEFDDVVLDAAHWDEAAQACRRGIMLARAGVMTMQQFADVVRYHECAPAGDGVTIRMLTWWDRWHSVAAYGYGTTLELAIADALVAAEQYYMEQAAKATKGGEG